MFFDNYRTRKKLETKRLEFEINQLDQLTKVHEARYALNDDNDFHQWIQNGVGMMDGMGMSNENHYSMLDTVFNKFHNDLFCKSIVNNLAKFILGKGPTIKPKDDNKMVVEVWEDFRVSNMWNLKEKEMVRRTFRDGELFIRKFIDEKTGECKVRFLRAQIIKNPKDMRRINQDENVTFGIGTDPSDVEDIKTYYLCNQDGNLIDAVSAEQIIHIKIISDSDMKRGISFLYTALPMIKKYHDWLEDRIVLNKVRSAIALIRKVEGSQSAIQSIRDAQQSQYQDSDRKKQQTMSRGTVLTASQGISYDMLSPKINAPDVKDDGRAMLLAVAAGIGQPEMFFTADYSNANYSSSMVAQNPFVREIEDWQDFFTFYYQMLFKNIVDANIKYGKLPKDTDTKCTIEWPPLILADIEKNNKAREIQHRNKIISKKTWQLKEALDPDMEEKNMEEEQGKDIYSQPFNLPTSPTNQWGSYNEDEEKE